MVYVLRRVEVKINKLFDYDDFSKPEFIKIQDEFYEKGGTSRKSWEVSIMAYGLDKLGCFSDTKTALGTGCLKESLIYLCAARFGHVHATDVAYYPLHDPRLRLWGGEGYTVEEVYESSILYDRSKLTVLPMDMMNLEFPDETFDVVWCSSSVEHCGGLNEILMCFIEAQRVLKPNGIFSITTEWNLTEGEAVRFANVQTFDYSVMSRIEKTAPRLALVEPLSLERSDNPKNKEKEYMLGRTNHFHGNSCDYTSVSLFWRKE